MSTCQLVWKVDQFDKVAFIELQAELVVLDGSVAHLVEARVKASVHVCLHPTAFRRGDVIVARRCIFCVALRLRVSPTRPSSATALDIVDFRLGLLQRLAALLESIRPLSVLGCEPVIVSLIHARFLSFHYLIKEHALLRIFLQLILGKLVKVFRFVAFRHSDCSVLNFLRLLLHVYTAIVKLLACEVGH